QTAMQDALTGNLDLAAEIRAVSAGRAEVGEARSVLLPQVDAEATGLWIDSDRAAASFGSQPEKVITGELSGSQILYDDGAFAQWSISRSQQCGREEELRQLRLDTARAAGGAYLDVLRAQTLERIRKDNLQRT